MRVTDPPPPSLPPLERLARLWRDRVDAPARKAAMAFAVGSVFGLAHLARLGTPGARITTGFILISLLSAFLARAIVSRRAWRNPEKVVARTILVTNPDLGGRTLRAMRLVDRTARDRTAGSEELARVHLQRTLALTQPDEVAARANRVGRIFQ